jgi:hypothetical protein
VWRWSKLSRQQHEKPLQRIRASTHFPEYLGDNESRLIFLQTAEFAAIFDPREA